MMPTSRSLSFMAARTVKATLLSSPPLHSFPLRKTIFSGACAPLCHVDFILSCSATFLIFIEHILVVHFYFFIFYYLTNDLFFFKTFLLCDPIGDPIRDPIRDPIHDPIRDPIRDPVRSDLGFVDAAFDVCVY